MYCFRWDLPRRRDGETIEKNFVHFGGKVGWGCWKLLPQFDISVTRLQSFNTAPT
jgi:hypothetical protein